MDKLPSKVTYKIKNNGVKVTSYPQVVTPFKDFFYSDFTQLGNQNNKIKNTTFVEFSNAKELLDMIERRVSHSENIHNKKLHDRKVELLKTTQNEHDNESKEADDFIERSLT